MLLYEWRLCSTAVHNALSMTSIKVIDMIHIKSVPATFKKHGHGNVLTRVGRGSRCGRCKCRCVERYPQQPVGRGNR